MAVSDSVFSIPQSNIPDVEVIPETVSGIWICVALSRCALTAMRERMPEFFDACGFSGCFRRFAWQRKRRYVSNRGRIALEQHQKGRGYAPVRQTIIPKDIAATDEPLRAGQLFCDHECASDFEKPSTRPGSTRRMIHA